MINISSLNNQWNKFAAHSKIIIYGKESLLYKITAGRVEILALCLITFLAPFLPVFLTALLILATSFLFLDKRRLRGITKLPLFKQVTVFWLLLVFYSIFSVTPRQSLAVTFLYGIFIIFYFLCLIELKEKKKIYLLTIVFLTSVMFEALFGLYQNFISRPLVDPGWIDAKAFPQITVRVFGTLDNPNILAQYLTPAIIIGLALAMWRFKPATRLVFSGQTAIIACCLFFTWSRGGWLALLVALAVFFLFYNWRIFLLGSLLFCALFWFQPEALAERLLSVTNLQETSVFYRIIIWQVALTMFRDFWFSGVGPGTFAFRHLYDQFYLISGFHAYHAHSFFLEMLVEIGFFGSLIFAWLLLSYFSESLKNIFGTPQNLTKIVALASFAGMIGYLAHGLTENSWYNFKLVFLFWFFMALTVSSARLGKNQTSTGSNKRLAPVPSSAQPGKNQTLLAITPGPAGISSKPPLNVLHIISDTNIGGAGRHLQAFLEYFDRSLLKVYVLCPAGSLLAAPFAAKKEVEVIEMAQMPGDESFQLQGLPRQIKEIVKIIKKHNIQVVHTHASFAGRLAAKIARVNYIVYTKHRIDEIKPGQGVKEKLFNLINHLTGHRVIAVSQAVKENLIQQGVKADKITVIYNGIDIEDFRRRAKDKSGNFFSSETDVEIDQALYPTAPDEPRRRPKTNYLVGVIARLEPEKGHCIFLEAAHHILTEINNVKFLIIGIGSAERKLKDYAHKLGIEHAVIFTGLRNDIPELISNLDVVVLPSLSESFGLSLVEGMCLGKPCVASNVGGIKEIITDGENGLLVEPGDARGLAEKIVFLLQNPTFTQELSRRAARTVEDKFDARSMAGKITALYYHC